MPYLLMTWVLLTVGSFGLQSGGFTIFVAVIMHFCALFAFAGGRRYGTREFAACLCVAGFMTFSMVLAEYGARHQSFATFCGAILLTPVTGAILMTIAHCRELREVRMA